jgi:two-component system, sensor histidine kinase and response regulator
MGNAELMESVKPVILIVDDNPQNLQVLGKQLIDRNYEIEFAINGAAALEWIEIKKFDLILLDINMPGMSGFDVCKSIRVKTDLNNVPIIFLSADTDRESILKGFELGAQDYITKPFDSRELIVRVRTHLALKESLEKLEKLNRSLEEKVAERTGQLRDANEKLEASNIKLLNLDKAKSEFLNLISHEIRTPLNGILGPLELLKGPVYAREIGELIGILDTSVRRLEKFSLDALLITRLKTSESQIRHEIVSLSGAANQALKDLSEKIEKKNLKISVEFNRESDNITGENELILKSVTSILDNAVVFSPVNGSIMIKTLQSGGKIVLETDDEGPGFSTGIMEEISLFSHSDKFRDESKGLSLPIVKMIMEAHGGEIELKNLPGKGACVKLLFNPILN